VSDEGGDNEPGEARQTSGAGPHRRQGELEYMLVNDLHTYLSLMLVLYLYDGVIH